MGKRRLARQRPFDPGALDDYAEMDLRPRMDPGERVCRYTIMVPVAELRPQNRTKATPADVLALEKRLVAHFGGVTILARVTGHGLRNPRGQPQIPEMNEHFPFVVYAAPLPESDAYFRTLQGELRDALAEGIILIERQEVIFL